MDTNINVLEPIVIWDIFANICKIPRPSKHEDQIRAWVVSKAQELQLEYTVTPIGNVIIQKKATLGMEYLKKVTMQCHMDMVPAKLATSKHNFLTDPISAYIDGEWVTADGTTLGADNGMGLAMGLAVLASDDVIHGPLELLVTTDEEAGMSGAFNLRDGDITGDILLNLDSEDDHEVCIGCAGGIDTTITYDVGFKAFDKQNKIAVKIALGSLVSGHSGCDIHIGRANANKEVAILLYMLNKQVGIQLAHISGGKLRNVIPAYCEAIIIIDIDQYDNVVAICEEFKHNFAIQFKDIETKFNLEIGIINTIDKAIIKEQSDKFINALAGSFSGIYQVNWDIGIAQMSSNLGVVKIEDNVIIITTLQRSPDGYAKDKLAYMVAASFEAIGANVTHSASYPGWLPNLSSEALQIVKSSYKQLFNNDIKVSATHGGLECGLIMSKASNIDAVSIGATIRDPHSANERVNIKSVAKVWELLKEILKNIPRK